MMPFPPQRTFRSRGRDVFKEYQYIPSPHFIVKEKQLPAGIAVLDFSR
jgi:hypothetical protein